MAESDVAAKVRELLRASFEFEPTSGQDQFISSFSRYAAKEEEGIFLLRGYAGTGKTTVLSAISRTFKNIVLLAPTGRAAKVLSQYTNRPAYTIHKHLYRPAQTSDGRMMLALSDNSYRRTLFIVDEASMIPDAAIDDTTSPFPGVNLLHDLLRYVFSAPGCKLLMVGDTAQLPPVHFDNSPALDANHLRLKYRRPVTEIELTEVVRQKEASGILKNATALRMLISRNAKEPILKSEGFADVIRLSPRDTPELLPQLYRKYGDNEVLVITRSNKSAIQYNRLIRFHHFWMEEEIGAGDTLMIVKNNYTWIPADHKAGFLANGEVVKVRKIVRFEERYGMRFATAILEIPDYPDDIPFEATLMLDTLSSEAPALSNDVQNKFYKAVHDYYELEEPNKRKRSELIRADPYYNALQVKFSYAVTCHKAQGGQWSAVVVDQGYLPPEMEGVEFLRWLYTAFTRATRELYLVNFEDRFFKV
jgi:exodeoxyribonuclease-5